MTTHTALIIPADIAAPITLIDVTDDDSLRTLQTAVGGYIEAAPIEREDCSLFVNEEGKLHGFPFNPRADQLWHDLLPGAWDRPDYAVGDVVLTGFNPETGDDADVPADLLARYGFDPATTYHVGDPDPTKDGLADCTAQLDGTYYCCTWPAGHTHLQHVAGTGSFVAATWPVTV